MHAFTHILVISMAKCVPCSPQCSLASKIDAQGATTAIYV